MQFLGTCEVCNKVIRTYRGLGQHLRFNEDAEHQALKERWYTWTITDQAEGHRKRCPSCEHLREGRHQLRGMWWPNVWEFPRVPFKQQLHPAEKPVGLIRRAIEASSDEGDLVVDPFAGSGATGEAALTCGRDALLGDVDPDYVRKGRLRLGLTLEDLVLPVVPTSPSSRCVPQWCMDALEGVHPEDIATLAAHFRRT